MKISLRAVVREAMIHNVSRPAQLKFIMNITGVNRNRAKELLFAFLYNAEDDFLLKIANRED